MDTALHGIYQRTFMFLTPYRLNRLRHCYYRHLQSTKMPRHHLVVAVQSYGQSSWDVRTASLCNLRPLPPKATLPNLELVGVWCDEADQPPA